MSTWLSRPFEVRLPTRRELTRTLVSVGLMGTALFAAPQLVHAPMDEVAAAATTVVDAPAEIVASIAHAGSHVGFDTDIYPGDRTMAAWIAGDSPYEWVGYYLPAACHKDTSWSGKRETLEQLGWGTAVIYVGQQSWPKRSGRAHAGTTCATSFVTAARGTRDAADAIARTETEGFPRGSVIFLDIERMDAVPAAMRAYYRAWARAVLTDGRYRPGIYAHEHNAQVVYADVKDEFTQAGAAYDPPFWVAGNSNQFAIGKNPEDVGHVFADVWQGLLDVVRMRNGIRLPVDVSVATVSSPSSHENPYSQPGQ